MALVRKPRCTRVLWRGVVVCSHSVPKLNAWAAATSAAYRLTPLAGCGSYQTTTAASAGTHAGGGAIDISANNIPVGERQLVARLGRSAGLQVDWLRPYRAGVWTNHYHAIDPDCPQLASKAAAQCVECFNGGDGLIGTKPDDGWRGNIAQLKTIFGNRLYTAVADIGTGIGGIAGTVVLNSTIKSVQSALRQDVDGKLGNLTYRAVWRLSVASVKGRAGFLGLSLDERKALQHDIGAIADGAWLAAGSEMPKKVADAVGGVQKALGTPIDRTWSTTVDGPAFAKVYTAAGYRPPPTAASVVPKIKAIQSALRLKATGVMDRTTYDAVWRLSAASRDGRTGFYRLTSPQRVALQKNIGAVADGVWLATGSEMPGKIRAAVGGVQRAMGIDIDRVWTDSDEGEAFRRVYTAVGFKP